MPTRSPVTSESVIVDAAQHEQVIVAALAQVLRSPHFSHAPRLSHFLQHIVTEVIAGRADQIKEYALAADVFARGSDYDSSTDAIVRVEAGRLRQKLRAYYDGEGRAATILIDLPKGSYVPVFRQRTVGTTNDSNESGDPGDVPAVVIRPRALVHAIYALVVALVVLGIGAVAILGTRDTAVVGARSRAAASTTDAQAVDLFLKGQYQRFQMTEEGVRAAVGSFEQATARDVTYAEAWAALGEARATLLFHGMAPAGTVSLVRHDIGRALALEPGLAEARGVLARLHLTMDGDWPSAEREFRRALEDAPGNARLHQWYAFALVSRGRFDDALAESRRAAELNPQAYVGTTDTSMLLFYARRYSEALAQVQQVISVGGRTAVAHVVAGMCLAATERYEEAIAEYRQAVGDEVTFTAVHAKLAHAYGRLGRMAEAKASAEELVRVFAPGEPPAVERALTQIGLGDLDAAMRALEQGFERREGDVLFFDVNPLFDPLRGDRRFAELRRRARM